MARTLICLLLVIVFTGNTFSQNYRKSQELFLEAEYFRMFEDYSDALPFYLQLFNEYPDNYNLAHKIGLCYLNIPGEKGNSLKYLELAANNTAADYREGSLKQVTSPYISLFDLANAYRINFQFDKAKETYRRYRETLLSDDTENILFVDHQIKVCDNAKELISNPVEFSEENIGEQFNDSNPNFHPILSADGSALVYMTSLKFYDAIFFAQKSKNRWSGPINVTPDIQSDGDLYISCLTNMGKTLYLSKISNERSDIYESRFDGVKWSTALKLDNIINSKYWDTHASVSEDGKVMIFASDRPGGFGGLDLYMARLNKEGLWDSPVNLGPEINTPFNEDRPFVSDGGNTLFFCSQGHFNMGGFDLFKTSRLQNGHWKMPENLGYPLNTPDDDTFFMPIGDGSKGYISAFRQDKGYGKEDIYLITLK